MAKASPEKKGYRPGDTVEHTGVYNATHEAHRRPHHLTMLKGEVFPLCKKCGDSVRFELIHAAERFTGDLDLW